MGARTDRRPIPRDLTVFLLGTLLFGPLVVYRLWRLAAVDTIFERQREWLATRDGAAWRAIYLGMVCPWCWGFWLSIAAGFDVALFTGAPPYLLLPLTFVSGFSISTIVGVMAELIERMERK